MARPPTEATSSVTATDLPRDFLLGAATSAYQVEGAVRAGGRGESIWDRFVTRPGAISDGTNADVACDHLARMDDDLELLAELGVDVHAFSISWSRIQPDGRGQPLVAGLDAYDRLVDGLLERGIQPWATLYRWDLPQALEDRYGGWRGRDTAGRFADYAHLMGELLGDRVTRWVTLDDPAASAWLGYERGVHAPGVQGEGDAVRAAHHLLTGHGLATQALRAAGAANVGIVLNLTDVRPASDTGGDVAAAELVDGMQNRFWLGALACEVPGDVVEVFASVLELETLSREGDAALAAQPLDWLGVSYDGPTYVAAGDGIVRRPPGPGLDGLEVRPPGQRDPGTMLGRHVDATGMTAVLEQAARVLPDTPIAVTGTGLALREGVDAHGAVDDRARIAFLTDHLAAALVARERGVPVDGYLVRSLLDGFEWADGRAPRCGLIHVDFATQVRTPKASYGWLRDLLRAR